MPLELDILTRLTNVQWGAELEFLYSGGDGMFRSSDGEKWEKVSSSVPAVSLAWIDDVWVGCNPNGGCWRSEDGATTWQSVSAPDFEEVVAMRPAGEDTDDNPLKGVFAGWKEDDDGNGEVYSSHDLGQTWQRVLTIDSKVGATGHESIAALSGCGEALFLTTQRLENDTDSGSVYIHISTDGHGFDKSMLFGPGTVADLRLPTRGYAGGHVGFDPQSKQYTATGYRAFGSGKIGEDPGEILSYRDDSLIYTTSSDASFGSGEGSVIHTERIVNYYDFIEGNVLGGPHGCAGGNGTFATGGRIIHDFFAADMPPPSMDLMAFLGTAGQVLVKSNSLTGFIGSFCFKKGGKESDSSDQTEMPPGTFACVAYSGTGAGGVFIANDSGSFTQTHAGTSIGGTNVNGGAVAVGKIS